MFYLIDDKTYVELTRSIISAKFERFETETVTLIIVVRIQNHIHRSLDSLDYVAFA